MSNPFGWHRVQTKSLLPVRWMPPESILYGKFTTGQFLSQAVLEFLNNPWGLGTE
jgi:hypothetical protein